jgi:hypothetical protein
VFSWKVQLYEWETAFEFSIGLGEKPGKWQASSYGPFVLSRGEIDSVKKSEQRAKIYSSWRRNNTEIE